MSEISDKHQSLAALLGPATGAEEPTPDGIGRFQHYERGSIYWTPQTGAHEVHGDIRALWSSLGWERSVLGYPTTDETPTPDGVGRFNHFQAGPTSGSIYWTPRTGAHEVHGDIHALWSFLGWERGPLGYPTSNEYELPHQAGRVSEFDKGCIYWDGGRGAYEVFPRPDYPPVGPADRVKVGMWEEPTFHAGISGLHTALLHTNGVLFLSYREPADPDNPGEVPTPFGESAVLDLASRTAATPAYHGAHGETALPNIFCSGHAFLPDGRLLVAGGDRENQDRLRSVHVFSPGGPGGGSWSYAGTLAAARWYPSVVTLPDGRMLMAGGEKRLPVANQNTTYEIFDPTTGTVHLPVSAPPMTRFGGFVTFPFLFVLPTRKLLLHGGTRTAFLDLTNFTFASTELETADRPDRNARTYGVEGTSVLLPLRPTTNPPYRARVMLIGGGGGGPAVTIRTPATASCEVLDLTATPLAWRLVAPLAHRRVMPDAVLLPDGSVLVMNGSDAGSADNGANPVWEAERYDPVANSWTTMAPMSVPRLYHATALLLPDGRVLTAGTDSLWNPGPFHEEQLCLEFYSPPYLFKGPRPTITSAPTQMSYASTAVIGTENPSSISSVSLLRCGSCTHSFNADQRFVELTITARSSTDLTVQAPPDGFVAPPGYYMLFLLRGEVPSTATFVRLS
ncbi:galactose oxidase-like domain-containing protein [Modestobacter excelsi]|uniref:galactose oxidase-like domain-containing protein n=1 Tax=Modestobacter excelsi TaxID=2213161 RepID=UPI00110CE9B2|nr:galactose oxidase-like domain-containing protein [Modestobacter excelsi]